MKFKVGDKVRITKTNAKGFKKTYDGKTAKIIVINQQCIDRYGVLLDINDDYVWFDGELEVVQ